MSADSTPLPIDWEHFLATHWQRTPLLIPAALPPGSAPPIDANELAGLALEPEVESRLIEYKNRGWHLQHGPFDEQDFDRDSAWTLLVQAVDHYVPAVSELKKLFSALPTWRMDDVMVSYASDGGSVGPHYDNYDVFLLQGEGQRRWQLGQRCDPDSALIPHPELRILDDFNCVEEFLLRPGDMLYVPPGVAHWGIAEGECTTFSIGFRAPSVEELLSRRIDAQLEGCPPEQFYHDAGIGPSSKPGEIRQEDVARLNTQMAEHLSAFSNVNWFGELVTEPRQVIEPSLEFVAEATERMNAATVSVTLCPTARVAWQALSSGQICVYANGHSRAFKSSVVEPLVTLCGGNVLTKTPAQKLSLREVEDELSLLLNWLLEIGCVDVE